MIRTVELASVARVPRRNVRYKVSKIWKSVEIFLPSDMSKDEVRTALRDGIIRTANEGGEFVCGFRVGASVAHDNGWHRWTVSYLPGPPGVFPD